MRVSSRFAPAVLIANLLIWISFACGDEPLSPTVSNLNEGANAASSEPNASSAHADPSAREPHPGDDGEVDNRNYPSHDILQQSTEQQSSAEEK